MPNENILFPRNFSRAATGAVAALGIAVFLVPLVAGGWAIPGVPALPRALSQFRNPLLGLSGLLLASLALRRAPWRGIDPERLAWPLLFLYLLAFLKAAFLDYAAFALNAIDFSIYDHAMANTLAGRFMESVTGVNHFGIHATPILFLLLPFHALFHSTLFVLFLHPAVLWLGAVALDRLAVRERVRGWPRIALIFSYLNSVLVSQTLHYGFHVEVFYPLFGFLLLGALTRGRPLPILGALVLFLSVKEDAPFYAVGIFVAGAMTRKIGWNLAGAFALLSAVVAAYELRVLIPANSAAGGYAFVGAAAGFGGTPGAAVAGALHHPLAVLRNFFGGGWWAIVLPAFGLLMFSPFFWLAALPFFGIYTLAGSPLMSGLALYYGMPLVLILFYGWIDGIRGARNPRHAAVALGLATAGACLFGGGYLVFRHADLARFRTFAPVAAEVARIGNTPAAARGICAPGTLIPHLGYPTRLRLLDAACVGDADLVVLADPGLAAGPALSTYPLEAAASDAIRAAVASWPIVVASGEFSLRRRPRTDRP